MSLGRDGIVEKANVAFVVLFVGLDVADLTTVGAAPLCAGCFGRAGGGGAGGCGLRARAVVQAFGFFADVAALFVALKAGKLVEETDRYVSGY